VFLFVFPFSSAAVFFSFREDEVGWWFSRFCLNSQVVRFGSLCLIILTGSLVLLICALFCWMHSSIGIQQDLILRMMLERARCVDDLC